jgi:hypothetical protein
MNLSGKLSSNDNDQRAYLKILERSVRTGRRIEEENLLRTDLSSNPCADYYR